MTAAAISGEFTDYKLIRTRSTLQIVIEIPAERQGEVFAALGYPMPGESLPVAVARLQASAAGENAVGGGRAPVATAVVPERAENRDAKSRYAAMNDMEKAALRAVLLCKDEQFQRWLHALSPSYRQQLSDAPPKECAALWMQGACGITSRREIATDYDAYGRFIALENRYKIATGQAAEPRS